MDQGRENVRGFNQKVSDNGTTSLFSIIWKKKIKNSLAKKTVPAVFNTSSGGNIEMLVRSKWP